MPKNTPTARTKIPSVTRIRSQYTGLLFCMTFEYPLSLDPLLFNKLERAAARAVDRVIYDFERAS